MHVVAFDEVPANEWDGLADRSQDAWLFHRHDWVRIESRFQAAGLHAFGVRDDRGGLAAVCPLYARSLGRGAWVETLLDSGHHRQAGPAFRDDLPAPERKAARKLVMREIADVAGRIDADRVQLNANNLAPARPGESGDLPFWLDGYGFRLGLNFGPGGDFAVPGMSTACADQVVDLTGTEEEVFDRLDPGFRKAVRKAHKGHVTVASVDPASAIDVYYELARRSAERTGESLPARDYYDTIWSAFGDRGLVELVLVEREGAPAAAVLLLVEKSAALFLAGVSDPAMLPHRVNNLAHWEAMRAMRRRGVDRYRLGPTFPEVPADWPIARVSSFKGQFGARSLPIVQGSWFRYPEKYLEDGRTEVERLCRVDEAVEAEPSIRVRPVPRFDVEGWSRVLRPYGVAFLESLFGETAETTAWTAERIGSEPATVLWFRPSGAESAPPTIQAEPGGRRLTGARESFFARPWPDCHLLLPHAHVEGGGITPVLATESGRTVVGWRDTPRGRELFVGVDLVEELVLRTHGDPARVETCTEKARWGFGHERPNYLYEELLVPDAPTTPWADRLGYTVAECLSRLVGLPLVEPLPNGSRGAVLLSGDDDEAYLEKYAEQLELVGDFPMTYFLLDRTRHTRETLRPMPASVEFGLHADALDAPELYGERCRQQCRDVAELCNRPVRTIRNHGFLSDGYLGQLPVWEECGLDLDVNVPGLDGTAVTGSYLPFSNRRPDGSWSDHRTLLTPFGDGMVYVLEWSDAVARRAVRRLCRQIDATRPGVVCLNMHPQNVSDVRRVHLEVMRWGRRSGWTALGAESYLDWLRARDAVSVRVDASGNARIECPVPVPGLAVRSHEHRGWRTTAIPASAGTYPLTPPGALRCAS